MENEGLKVLIIDDSHQMRRTISALVKKELAPVEVHTAENGRVGLLKATRVNPQLVILDLSMPEMDGFTFLRLFRARYDTPVMVLSSLDDLIYIERAIQMGANSFLGKPGDMAVNEDAIGAEFRMKIGKLLPYELLKRRKVQPERAPRPAPEGAAMASSGDFTVVVIGCSSGGPDTLQFLLSALPEKIKAAILIAQHMPKGFTGGMAERLQRMMRVPIKEVCEGDEILPGRVYFCPGGMNAAIVSDGHTSTVKLSHPKGKEVSPNVDLLFRSAAQVFGSRTTGIVLTGMGRDGSEGVRKIKEAGGTVIAESVETAAIYGMPREAAATGCVDSILPLQGIAKILAALSSEGLKK